MVQRVLCFRDGFLSVWKRDNGIEGELVWISADVGGGFPQDELGVWTSPGGAKVAWFKDPDGNTLSLTEFSEGD